MKKNIWAQLAGLMKCASPYPHLSGSVLSRLFLGAECAKYADGSSSKIIPTCFCEMRDEASGELEYGYSIFSENGKSGSYGLVEEHAVQLTTALLDKCAFPRFAVTPALARSWGRDNRGKFKDALDDVQEICESIRSIKDFNDEEKREFAFETLPGKSAFIINALKGYVDPSIDAVAGLEEAAVKMAAEEAKQEKISQLKARLEARMASSAKSVPPGVLMDLTSVRNAWIDSASNRASLLKNLSNDGVDKISPLGEDENEELEVCTAKIRQGLAGFYLVGKYLLVIHAKKLYRARYKRFDEYTRTEFGFEPDTALRQISAYMISEIVDGEWDESPASWKGRAIQNEAQAREIDKLSKFDNFAELAKEVVAKAQARAEKLDRRMLAPDIEWIIKESYLKSKKDLYEKDLENEVDRNWTAFSESFALLKYRHFEASAQFRCTVDDYLKELQNCLDAKPVLKGGKLVYEPEAYCKELERRALDSWSNFRNAFIRLKLEDYAGSAELRSRLREELGDAIAKIDAKAKLSKDAKPVECDPTLLDGE